MKHRIKVIAVTGTPGTGKTTLSKELSLLMKYGYVDPIKMFGKKVMDGYDNIRRTSIVDPKKLVELLVGLIGKSSEEGLVIDSHMSHFLPSKHVNLCIVTRTNLKTLKRRLEKKGYPEPKVRENLDSEIFEICLTEAAEKGHKLLILDTTRQSPKTLARRAADKIKAL